MEALVGIWGLCTRQVLARQTLALQVVADHMMPWIVDVLNTDEVPVAPVTMESGSDCKHTTVPVLGIFTSVLDTQCRMISLACLLELGWLTSSCALAQKIYSQVCERCSTFEIEHHTGFDVLHQPPLTYGGFCWALVVAHFASELSILMASSEAVAAAVAVTWSHGDATNTGPGTRTLHDLVGFTVADVLKWLYHVRSYPFGWDGNSSTAKHCDDSTACDQESDPKSTAHAAWFEMVYAVTHIVYAVSGYQAFLLPTDLLQPEIQCLRSALVDAIRLQNPDMVAEVFDCMVILGERTDTNPDMMDAILFLLESQNVHSGSWTGASIALTSASSSVNTCIPDTTELGCEDDEKLNSTKSKSDKSKQHMPVSLDMWRQSHTKFWQDPSTVHATMVSCWALSSDQWLRGCMTNEHGAPELKGDILMQLLTQRVRHSHLLQTTPQKK
jgi:hypothetical protein